MPPGSASASRRAALDAVAVDVAFLQEDVADVDADPERDPPILVLASLALGHVLLNGDRAFHGVDGGRELDQGTVAHQLHDAAVILGD
jgi:hypothetical protein